MIATLEAQVAALSAALDQDRHEFIADVGPATGQPSMWCAHYKCPNAQFTDRIHRTARRHPRRAGHQRELGRITVAPDPFGRVP